MTPLLVVAMPGNEATASDLAHGLGAEIGQLQIREFPDGESYVRFLTDPARRTLIIVCTLAHPNDKILQLIFSSATARELGATRVGLVSPYLAYMRQDRRFKTGEAVTSRQVARLLSDAFDWIVTIDPHLHRYGSLGEIYTIPTRVLHAAPMISQWVEKNVTNPLIIGPDSESEQWVSAVAKNANAPFTVLEKIRRGDRDVEISVKNLDYLQGRTAVLIDDIISTGRTMIQAVRHVLEHGSASPVCIAVHGLFSDDADRALVGLGARVVTCNTIPHPTNAIDVGPVLIEPTRALSLAAA
jgi:ribose-phosphate pyrophosphokinase